MRHAHDLSNQLAINHNSVKDFVTTDHWTKYGSFEHINFTVQHLVNFDLNFPCNKYVLYFIHSFIVYFSQKSQDNII